MQIPDAVDGSLKHETPTRYRASTGVKQSMSLYVCYDMSMVISLLYKLC